MATYVLVHGAWHTGAELEPTGGVGPVSVGGESGRGGVIEKVVRHPKTKLGLSGNSKSHSCLGEIVATLTSIAGLLNSGLKLQASTGDDNTRTCDLRPVRGDGALRIGTAGLSVRLECEGSRHDGQEQRRCRPRHAEDSNGRPISQESIGGVVRLFRTIMDSL